MSSESSESEEEDNFTKNHQFNGQQTEIVVEYVAAITRFISRFLEKNAKEQRKAIRKKNRKAKVEKSKDNLQTCIQKLCNTIKETFSPFYVQAELPGCSNCSRQSIVPGTSKNDTGIPKTSKSNTETAVPGSSNSDIETGAYKRSAETMHSNGQAKAAPETSVNHWTTIRISSERNESDTTGNLKNVIDTLTQSTIPLPEATSSPETTKSVAAPGKSRSHTNISGISVTSTSTTDAMRNSSGQAKAVPVTSRNDSQPTKRNSIENIVSDTPRSYNHTETSGNLSNCNEKIVHATAKQFTNSIPEARSTTKTVDIRSSATVISEMINSCESNPTGSHTKPFSGFPDNRIKASCGISKSHAAKDPEPSRKVTETIRVSNPGTECNAEIVVPVTSKSYTAGKLVTSSTAVMQHSIDQAKEVPAPSKSFQKSTNISKNCTKTPGNLTDCIDKIVPEASIKHSDAAEFRASIPSKAVVTDNSEMSGNSAKLTPVTYKSPTETASGTKDCTGNALTKTNTVVSKMSSNITSKSSTKTTSDNNTSKVFTKTCFDKSKTCTGTMNPVYSESHTNIHAKEDKIADIPKKLLSGFPEKHAEGSGSPKSHYERKAPESSRKHTETDITTTAINRSSIAKSETSIQNKTISSTKLIPETFISSIRAAPVSKNYTNEVETKNPENVLKAVKENPNNRPDSTMSVTLQKAKHYSSKVIHETSTSTLAVSSAAIPNNTEVQNTISSNVLHIGKRTPKNWTERTKAVTFKENKTITVEAGIPAIAQNRTKTLSATSRNRTEVSLDSRSYSGTEVHDISRNAPIARTSKFVPSVEPSTSNRCSDKPKNRNSDICMQEHVINTENDKRTDNTATTKRNNEANLKRNHTSSVNGEPKKARLKYKCFICRRSICYNKAAKHYKKKHGIHHEMKHNSKNYEHKMKGLKRRLSDPVNRKEKNSENEQGEIKTVDSQKRSLKRPNECIEHSVANITQIEFADTDELNEPVAKKKRAVTGSDSISNEPVAQSTVTIVASFIAEVNRETVLDVYTIDLTENNDLDGLEPPTNVSVKNCDSKPVEDDHTLNDHLFIDPINDTSLYETTLENDTKSAEAFLMKNVKEEGVDSQLDTDMEVVSNFFLTPSNQTSTVKANLINTEPNTKKIKQNRIQGDSLRKRNSTEAVVPGSAKVVPGSSKNTTENRLKVKKQSAEATVSGNPLNRLDVKSRDADGTTLDAAKIGHSKPVAISPIEQTNQKITQDKLLLKRNEESTRKLPCEANSKHKDPDNVSEAIATNRHRKAPKKPKLNSATSITIKSTQETTQYNSQNYTYRADSNMNKLEEYYFNGTRIRSLSPEVSASTSNSTAGTSKQLKEEAKQSNTKNNLITNLAIHGLTITAVNVPSVSNSTSADKHTSVASTSASSKKASQNKQEPQKAKPNSSNSTPPKSESSKLKQNTCKRIEIDISSAPSRRDSVTEPRNEKPIPKNPANVQNNLTGSSAQTLEHQQNGLSQSRDKKTEDVSTGQNVSNMSSEHKTPDHKLKHLPQKAKPNSSNSIPPPGPSKLKQNTCTRIEMDISSAASPSRRESVTDPRKEKLIPKDPANVQKNQTGSSVQNLEHQQNGLPQSRDSKAEYIATGQNVSNMSSEHKTPDHKQEHLPQKAKPNSSNSTPLKQEPSKLKQNSCKRIEIDISSAASPSRRDSVKPKKEIPISKNPENVQKNQTGYSEHQQNRLSQSRDKNTENISTGFNQNNSNRLSELNQRQNTERPIKEVPQTHCTTSPRSNAKSGRERNLTKIQTPQIAWSPPKPLERQHQKIIPKNTNRSNIAERMSNRRGSTHNNTPPRRYSWHIPVEPEERPVNQNVTANATLNPVSRKSPQPETSGLPAEPRIPNEIELSSTSEVGQPILVLRHASTMIDRRRSNPQSVRTWHIPEEERTQK